NPNHVEPRNSLRAALDLTTGHSAISAQCPACPKADVAVLHLRCLGPTQRRDPVSSSIGGQPPSPLARSEAHYGLKPGDFCSGPCWPKFIRRTWNVEFASRWTAERLKVCDARSSGVASVPSQRPRE